MFNYVYVFTDPKYNEYRELIFNNIKYSFKHRIIYVGKGSNSGKYDRIQSHFYHRKHRKTPFYDWLNKRINDFSKEYIKNNCIFKIINCVDTITAYGLEETIITELGRKDNNSGYLLNLSNGGQGSNKLSDVIKNKISLKNKGRFIGKLNGNYKNKYKYFGENNPYYGKKHTDDIRLKMRRSYIVYNMVDDTKYIVNDIYKFIKDNNMSERLFSYKKGCSKLYKKQWCYEKINKEIA